MTIFLPLWFTITATTSHDENYKRGKHLGGQDRWEKLGFSSREPLSKLRSKILDKSLASYINLSYQKTSRATWKGSQTCNSAFLQHFCKTLLSIAASRKQRRKRRSGGQKYPLESCISQKKQKMWSYDLAEGQHRGRPEQLVSRITFTYSTQSTLARALSVTRNKGWLCHHVYKALYTIEVASFS